MSEFIFSRLIPALFSRPLFQPLNRLLFRVASSGMGVNNWNGRSADERRFLLKARDILPPKPVILNVGANEGQFARMARAAFPDATIISFEPNPSSFKKLQKVADELRLVPVPLGCGDTSCRAQMFDVAEGAGSELASVVPGVTASYGEASSVFEIELITIDEYADREGLARIDYLKIDVEGFELSVLKGAEEMIRGRRIAMIQIEFNDAHVLSRTSVEDLQQALPGYGIHRLLYSGDLLPLSGHPAVRRNLYQYQNLIAMPLETAPR